MGAQKKCDLPTSRLAYLLAKRTQETTESVPLLNDTHVVVGGVGKGRRTCRNNEKYVLELQRHEITIIRVRAAGGNAISDRPTLSRHDGGDVAVSTAMKSRQNSTRCHGGACAAPRPPVIMAWLTL